MRSVVVTAMLLPETYWEFQRSSIFSVLEQINSLLTS